MALLNAEYDEEKHEAHTRYIKPLAKVNFETLQEASKIATVSLDNFVKEWIAGYPNLMGLIIERPSFRERLAHESGFIPPEVFEAERLKTIQKLNKKSWSDMEIVEIMELDLHINLYRRRRRCLNLCIVWQGQSL